MLFDFGYVHPRWIWVALVIIFAVIEGLTLGLTTIWFALAAFIMVFLSFLPIPLPYQILIFLILSSIFLIFTRPIALKKFKIGKTKTNVDSLIGKHALVVKQITEFDRGEIKVSGQIWSARLEEGTVSPLIEGTKCEIVQIEGVQAIVRALQNIENNEKNEN
ncbi:MAG: NfeD family protein [Treponema sp.]|nr:NfeD family protein [Treponema sp.]